MTDKIILLAVGIYRDRLNARHALPSINTGYLYQLSKLLKKLSLHAFGDDLVLKTKRNLFI